MLFRFLFAVVVCGLISLPADAGIEVVAKAKVKSVAVKEHKETKAGWAKTEYTFVFSERATEISEEAAERFVGAMQGKNAYSIGAARKGNSVTVTISGGLFGTPVPGRPNVMTLKQIVLPPAPFSSLERKEGAGDGTLALIDVALVKVVKEKEAVEALKLALASLVASEREPLKAEDLSVSAEQPEKDRQPALWRFTLTRMPKKEKPPLRAPVPQKVNPARVAALR